MRKPGKIRVGYASPELANKNGTRWSIGWLKSHGGEFETYAINLGNLEDRMTERFVRAADHYLSLPISVPQAARAIKDLESMRSRLSVAFHRQAGTSGLIASSPDEYINLACDFDRQREIMAASNPSALLEDQGVGEALAAFIRLVARPS